MFCCESRGSVTWPLLDEASRIDRRGPARSTVSLLVRQAPQAVGGGGAWQSVDRGVFRPKPFGLSFLANRGYGWRVEHVCSHWRRGVSAAADVKLGSKQIRYMIFF